MLTSCRSPLNAVYGVAEFSGRARQALGRAGEWIVAIGWPWLIIGIAIRIALSPLQHTWDSQTWWNVVGALGREGNPIVAIAQPYEQMRQLSDLARGSGFRPFYEYWAYPPGMLVVWWPIAHAWYALGDPLVERFASPDAFTAMPIPVALSLGLKLPAIAGDVATTALLAWLAGSSIARWYWLNPYVLLVGMWTFDSVMVAFLVGGVAAALRQRWLLAGVLLGIGGAVKFVPLLLVPVVLLWALRTSPRPIASLASIGMGVAASLAVLVAPWWDQVWYVLQFHGGRAGGGMSWQAIWGALTWLDPLADLAPIYAYTSAAVGVLTLGSAVLIATWLGWVRRLDLVRMSLVVILAYLAGSKLVNEVYPLPAVALAAVSLAMSWSVGGARLLLFLWVTPLLFALVNVPAWGFLLAPAQLMGWADIATVRTFMRGYILTFQYLAPVLALAGAAFQVGCLVGVWSLVRPIGRSELREAFGVAP